MEKRTRWVVDVDDPNPSRRTRSYVLVYRPPAGAIDECGKRYRVRRFSSGTEDQQEAQLRARQEEARLNTASGILARGETVRTVVDAYLATNKHGVSYHTQCYSALKAAPDFARLSVSRVDRAAVLRARDAMRAGRANSTVNSYLRNLAAAWRWAEERGLVPSPWPRVKKLCAKTSKRPYEPAEVQAVLDWLERNPRGFADWFAYFSLLADTGARPGELVRLKGQDVDRAGGRARVIRNKSGPNGDARVEEWIRVPLATIALLPQRDPGHWLWPARGRQGKGHITTNGALSALRRGLQAIGIPWRGKLDQASFRRWWIDSADAEGVSIGDAMKQTGHRKVETHAGYRRNSTRTIPAASVESVRARRLDSATGARNETMAPACSTRIRGARSQAQATQAIEVCSR
jgi:integrase